MRYECCWRRPIAPPGRGPWGTRRFVPFHRNTTRPRPAEDNVPRRVTKAPPAAIPATSSSVADGNEVRPSGSLLSDIGGSSPLAVGAYTPGRGAVKTTAAGLLAGARGVTGPVPSHLARREPQLGPVPTAV
jgi:hypothetical protein